jgi:O-antigen ligase
MHVIINHARIEPNIIHKTLNTFVLSTIVLTILYTFHYETTYSLENRATIFNINQNELGIKLCISLLIIIGGLKEIGIRKGKLFYYIFAPLLLIFLIQTGSRVAFIALTLGIAVYYLLSGPISISKIFRIIMVALAFIFIWNFFVVNTFLSERIISAMTQGDLSGRDARWAAAFDIFLNNPLFGVGQLGFNEKVQSVLGYYSSPHNVLIEILSYSGIIGILLFLFFLINILKCVIKIHHKNIGILPLVLFIPVFGVILSGQILGSKLIWLLFAYMISVKVYSFNKTNLHIIIK